MMAAAIVCAAAFAQAASIDWSVGANSWTLSNGTKAAKDTTVYFINGATSLSDIASAVSAGTITSADWYYGSATTENTKGYISTKTATSDTKLVAGKEYSFSVLMVDGDKYMVSAVNKQNAYTTGSPDPLEVTFSSSYMNANSQTASAAGAVNGWATASVPEPTSGLLLLLGVAGMALRRRRA